MQTKTDLFPPDLARIAEAAKALTHPARLAILQTLAERGTCVCAEVVDDIPLAQATVSSISRPSRPPDSSEARSTDLARATASTPGPSATSRATSSRS